MTQVVFYNVSGVDPTPDGYRDHLLYRGRSMWGALRAVRAALREGMEVSVRFTL